MGNEPRLQQCNAKDALLRKGSCGQFIPRRVNQPAYQNVRRPKLAWSLQTGSRLDHRTLIHLLSLPNLEVDSDRKQEWNDLQ